jgi:hypothetical protein
MLRLFIRLAAAAATLAGRIRCRPPKLSDRPSRGVLIGTGFAALALGSVLPAGLDIVAVVALAAGAFAVCRARTKKIDRLHDANTTPATAAAAIKLQRALRAEQRRNAELFRSLKSEERYEDRLSPDPGGGARYAHGPVDTCRRELFNSDHRLRDLHRQLARARAVPGSGLRALGGPAHETHGHEANTTVR